MKLRFSRHRTLQLLLLSVLLFVQLGLFIHQIEHTLAGDDTHCALCMAADHLGHAPVSGAVFAGISCVFLLLSITFVITQLPYRAHVLRSARAPPRFSSLL